MSKSTSTTRLPLVRRDSLLYQRLADLKPREVQVYVVLLAHADRSGECWPSIDTIVSATGLERKTVMAATKGLEEKGMVGRRRGRREQGTIYQLHTDSSVVPKDGTSKPRPKVPKDGTSKKSSSPNSGRAVVPFSGSAVVPFLGAPLMKNTPMKSPMKKKADGACMPHPAAAEKQTNLRLLKTAGVRGSNLDRLADGLTTDRLVKVLLKAMSLAETNLPGMLVRLLDDGDNGGESPDYRPQPIDATDRQTLKAVEILLEAWPGMDRDKAERARHELARRYRSETMAQWLVDHRPQFTVPYRDGTTGPVCIPTFNPVLALELFELSERKPEQPSTTDALTPRQLEARALWDAVAAVAGFSPGDELSDGDRHRIREAVKKLQIKGGNSAEVPRRWALIKTRWPDATLHQLIKFWVGSNKPNFLKQGRKLAEVSP